MVHGHGERILVLDDDEGVLMLVVELLEQEGYEVTFGRNGVEGMARLDERPPELALVDLSMPLMDGPSFVEAMRARGIDVPVLVMSSNQNIRVWADRLRADGCLAKPFDVGDLLEKVEHRLAERRDH